MENEVVEEVVTEEPVAEETAEPTEEVEVVGDAKKLLNLQKKLK